MVYGPRPWILWGKYTWWEDTAPHQYLGNQVLVRVLQTAELAVWTCDWAGRNREARRVGHWYHCMPEKPGVWLRRTGRWWG